MDDKVDILLATYNGEKYLENQLESIVNQTYNNWHLYISDDISNDCTIEIINFYKQKYPDRITIIINESKLGAKSNFMNLLSYTTSNYIMFSDQDDFWLEDKIQVTLDKMKRVEQNKKIPLLVHTDLKVVDKDLKIINHSFWKYQNLNPNINKLNRLLIQNNVTGCTMMINKNLCDIVKNNEFTMSIMHDWIIAIIAVLFGEIHYLNKSTILYRQHYDNTIGTNKFDLFYIIDRLKNIRNLRNSFKKIIEQATEIKHIYGDIIKDEDMRFLIEISNIYDKNFLARKKFLIKHRAFKHGIIRILGQLIIF